MGSLSRREWAFLDFKETEPQVEQLRRLLSISSTFSQVLITRNLQDTVLAHQYLEPSVEQCHSPFLMRGMSEAVRRIYLALVRSERIVVYGDYDVDGTLSTALLYRYLKQIGAQVHSFIPERLRDGYGMTPAVIEELKKQKTNLIITVDNGSTAVQESLFIRELGMDLIITDHHRFGELIPEAVAILNPHHPQCRYPFKGLCAAGVGFKLLQGLELHLTEENFWKEYGFHPPDLSKEFDLVALATVADRVPLTDENRYLVQRGLEVMNHSPRLGLKALIRECGIEGPITPVTISFKLAPKINAIGRVSSSRFGVQLFVSDDPAEIAACVRSMLQANVRRQTIEQQVFKKAVSLANSQQNEAALILVNEHWHPGVMGSISSRIAHQFGKPTLMLTCSPDKNIVGSGRSHGSIDIHHALEECDALLERYGGHKMAVGLSLKPENLPLFRKQFIEALQGSESWQSSLKGESLQIDAWVEPTDLQHSLAHEFLRMSPFGMENQEPVLGIPRAQITSARIFKERHLHMSLEFKEQKMDVVAWERASWHRQLTPQMDLAVSIQLSESLASQNPMRFKVLDVKPCQ